MGIHIPVCYLGINCVRLCVGMCVCVCLCTHTQECDMSLPGKAGRNSQLSITQMSTTELVTAHFLTISGEKQALSRAQFILSSEVNHLFKRLFLAIICKWAEILVSEVWHQVRWIPPFLSELSGVFHMQFTALYVTYSALCVTWVFTCQSQWVNLIWIQLKIITDLSAQQPHYLLPWHLLSWTQSEV